MFHLCCLGGEVPADGRFSPGDLLEWGHLFTQVWLGVFRPGECLVGFVRRSFLVALWCWRGYCSAGLVSHQWYLSDWSGVTCSAVCDVGGC